MMAEFLPVSQADLKKRGWSQCDFVYIIGDAYVDHPSFGHAIISRVLEDAGYKVGILSQPDWRDERSILALGEPRLGYLVTGGNMDSMVNHYAVSKKHRARDAYTPGGVMGKRPDYATVVYCNLIRRTFPRIPILIGGIEASLRRLAHYDYWSDKIKRSILLDSQADLLLYGMGERSIVEAANALNDGMDVRDITWIDGTVFKTKAPNPELPALYLPSYAELQQNRRRYAESFAVQYRNTDPFTAQRLVEPYGEHEFVVQNPPQKPLSQQEMDRVYDLPYCRTYHPSYEKLGGVPAIEEIEFSLVSNRGCFGACSFCALTFHQGRIIQARSQDSILREAEAMTKSPGFKGYIHDVGGPTADFRQPACPKQLTKGACPDRQCLFPAPCKNLVADHSDYLSLLRKLRRLPGVKKVFIRSGIRFDYLLADKNDAFFRELVKYHISGQLKVAPEHVSDEVLAVMGKPRHSVYLRFLEKYEALNREAGKKAVRRAVPHVLAPRLHDGRGRQARGIPARHGPQPRAGAGLLPHALDALDRHVLHGPGPAHDEAGLRADQSARKGHAARAHPVPRPQKLRARARGAAEGRAAGSHRLRAGVPHPPVPEAGKGRKAREIRRTARPRLSRSPRLSTPC
jgi:uncharacterized radical SAM protein YgiQ